MKYYYSDPNSQNLIIRDTEKNEIVVLERITSVRVVLVGGEVQLGDFDGDGSTDALNEGRPYSNHNMKGKKSKLKIAPPDKKARKPTTCKLCTRTGHTKKTCPDRPVAPPADPDVEEKEVIEQGGVKEAVTDNEKDEEHNQTE